MTRLFAALAALAAGAAAPAADPSPGEAAFLKALGRTDATVVPLWSTGVAPGEPKAGLVESVSAGRGEVAVIHAVAAPSMVVVPPPAGTTATGLAVLCCPGGGYGGLETTSGVQMARWLNAMGGTAVFLKYRVPRRGPNAPKHELPLQDAQRALGLLRSRAKEFGIDPKKIGVAGFSAGGHLAAMLSNHHAKRTYGPVDDHDKAGCRPDFALLVYPAYLTDPIPELKPDPALDLAGVFPERTPPTLVTVLRPDKFTVGCVSYFTALRGAKVPAELHVYESGGHGGVFDKYPLLDWGRQAARFLRNHGFLDATAAESGNGHLAKLEPGVRASEWGHIDRVGGPKAPPRPAAKLPALPAGLADDALGEADKKLRERLGGKGPVYALWPAGADRATLAVLRPEKPDGRAAVVVGDGADAADAARRVSRLGVTAFVSRCREAATTADVQRAVGLVRSRAAEFGVDPEWVGVVGVAAGGKPAAACGHRYNDRDYKAADAHDRAPCRPAFVALVSPTGLAAKDGSVDKALTGTQRNRVPPVFVAGVADDAAVDGTLRYVLELREGRVPVAAHVFERGGEAGRAEPLWVAAFGRWLNDLVPPAP